ncbi:TDT family transporter [Gudongella sp. DL1XJH-153]|uniref:TDT family transporter n=1 Tax=Gudongella sp. DL1XJH-153 TaxID=3409804 RepID=UPI003BB53136
MKSIIERVPVPITGLFLGLAATGNLVQSYGESYRSIFGFVALILFIAVLLKLILNGEAVKKELENPVVASVYPTLTMGMMLLATYLKPVMPGIAPYFWGTAIILHSYLIIRFSVRFLKDFNIKKVFPSWYIVYVGIVVGSVTSPAFQMQALGRILFWFGLASYFALLPVVLKRVLVVKEIPEPALPTFVIMCAPASLLLAGYMNAFPVKSIVMVLFLLALSQVTYIYVLVKLPKLLGLKFYPSYSAFTFPMVITAISLKATAGYFSNLGMDNNILGALVKLQEFVAVALVLYVLARYLVHMRPSAVKIKAAA